MAVTASDVAMPAEPIDDRASDAEVADALLNSADRGAFNEADVADLPARVARHLASVIAPGTPTAGIATITMRGHIKVGRWLPFSATEILDPCRGFVWSARVAGGVIAGSDRYLAGAGRTEWKVLGLVPLMRAGGPDVARSAVGRAAGESVWVPTAMLPRHGVRWSVRGATTLTSEFAVDGVAVTVTYGLGGDGRVQSVALERWGDPDRTGSYGWHPFGGEVGAHRTFAGLTVPTAGRIGWHYGTDRWPDGEFFRFTITNLELPALDHPASAR